MGRSNVRRVKLRRFGKCSHGCVIAHDEIEHARQKSGIGGCAAQGLGSDPAFGQKCTQPFRIARDKGKRLNCNDFSYFPRVPFGFSQDVDLPFRNLWSLVSEQSCPSLRKLFKQLATTSWKWSPCLTGWSESGASVPIERVSGAGGLVLDVCIGSGGAGWQRPS
jgi:hypothetical protein